MKLFYIALLGILCSACASGVVPYVGDRDHKSVTITWVRVDPVLVGPTCEQKLRQTYGERLPVGCATFGSDDKGKPVCTIYAAVPLSAYGEEVIGHETLHCFLGNWHP